MFNPFPMPAVVELESGLPPLLLRLITLHNGKNTIYLVTNELNMTSEQAGELYKERWGVEVFFRSVNQSCRHSKLHCQTPQNVLSELNWALLGLWSALFQGKQTLAADGEPLSRLSPSKAPVPSSADDPDHHPPPGPRPGPAERPAVPNSDRR